jgi:hypothetical protein
VWPKANWAATWTSTKLELANFKKPAYNRYAPRATDISLEWSPSVRRRMAAATAKLRRVAYMLPL